MYAELYQNLYKALFNQGLGMFIHIKYGSPDAYNHLMEAKAIYENFSISKGIINSQIITNYRSKKDYLNVINLCLEMEEYYISTNNIKRLFAVYTMLSETYLCIKSHKSAKEYHVKIMEILKQEKSLERYRKMVYFNWGLFLIENYEFEEALEPLEEGYRLLLIDKYKLRYTNVILFLLTKLKKENSLIDFYIQDGQSCLDRSI